MTHSWIAQQLIAERLEGIVDSRHPGRPRRYLRNPRYRRMSL